MGAACGGSDLADQAQEVADAAEQATDEGDEAPEEEQEDAAEPSQEAAAPPAAVDLPGLTTPAPSATVYQRGFEFTVTDLPGVDLDRQHAEETGTEMETALDGLSFDVEGIEVTITRGMVFYETASAGPLPDGEVLLELTYDVDNAAS